MSRTIHLYNENILTNPLNSEFCDAITIDEGIVRAQSVLAIDLQGAFPGFIDSHMHLVHSSSAMGDVVVLDQNPLHCDWNLKMPSVTMTIQAGNIVHKKDACFE